MSCIYCKHYAGLNQFCYEKHMVTTTYESLFCDEYQYNGEVKEDDNSS